MSQSGKPSWQSTSHLIVRFYKYSGSTYTAIGSITDANTLVAAKTTYTIAVTTLPSMPFGAGDFLYTDVFLYDSAGVSGDNPTVYVSTSSASGVANDMQVTTPLFPDPALTLWGNTAASSLSTANVLVNVGTGTTSGAVATTIGTFVSTAPMLPMPP